MLRVTNRGHLDQKQLQWFSHVQLTDRVRLPRKVLHRRRKHRKEKEDLGECGRVRKGVSCKNFRENDGMEIGRQTT